MDFEYQYTQEQEQFRREVSAWLDANLPDGVASAGGLPRMDSSKWEECKSFSRRLGEKGWLDLTADLALVFLEEMGKRRLGWLLEDGSSALRAAIQQWGTTEQKTTQLPLLASGQVNLWRHWLMEPDAPQDVSNLGIKAFRDGDDIILDGQDLFLGQGLWPDYLWALAIVNPEAPPEDATATFLVSSRLEGISIQLPKALVPGQNHRVTFDHVRVFPDARVGEEGAGWRVVTGAVQALYPVVEDQQVQDLLQYSRETTWNGASLGKDLVFQQVLVEAFINSRISRLFKVRNAWMASTGQPMTYELAETALWEKQLSLRLSRIVRDVMGMYALLDPEDPRAPLGGSFEFQQRHSLAIQNPTGASEVHAVELAKQLGLGKKEGEETTPSSGTPAGVHGADGV